jgi:large subunit ribosomal protein L21
MYAIVEIAGQQFKVEKGNKIYVNRLAAEKGAKLDFDNVLLVDNAGAVKLGIPTIAGAKVSATVVDHIKGDKVLIFHKKRRKGYQKMNGYRHSFTQLTIDSIIA